MFNNLLESKPKRRSAAADDHEYRLHSILVGLAVYATANAAIKNEKPRQEKIDFVETPKGRTTAAEGRATPTTAAGCRGRAAPAQGVPGAHRSGRHP
jgi:hypothetical protein